MDFTRNDGLTRIPGNTGGRARKFPSFPRGRRRRAFRIFRGTAPEYGRNVRRRRGHRNCPTSARPVACNVSVRDVSTTVSTTRPRSRDSRFYGLRYWPCCFNGTLILVVRLVRQNYHRNNNRNIRPYAFVLVVPAIQYQYKRSKNPSSTRIRPSVDGFVGSPR